MRDKLLALVKGEKPKEKPIEVKDLKHINWNNEAVITTKLLAQVYECKELQIQQNFNNNQDRFIEGKHYYKLEGEELKEFKNCIENIESVGISKNTRNLILWTKKGASRHCKMLGTDKAWDVFDLLEDNYFNTKVQLSKLDQAWLDVKYNNVEKQVDYLILESNKALAQKYQRVLADALNGEGRQINLSELADQLNKELNINCNSTNITDYLTKKGYFEKVKFIKEIPKGRYKGTLYLEEKSIHKQPTELFMNEFVRKGLAITQEPKDNGKIIWKFTDRFINYFIDIFKDDFIANI